MDKDKLIKKLNEFLGETEEDKIVVFISEEDTEEGVQSKMLLLERSVSVKGKKWVIHKYDKDEFPSAPHAHDYENGIKLHLGTGEMFRSSDLTSVGHYSKKHFLRLRDNLNVIELPPLNYKNFK